MTVEGASASVSSFPVTRRVPPVLATATDLPGGQGFCSNRVGADVSRTRHASNDKSGGTEVKKQQPVALRFGVLASAVSVALAGGVTPARAQNQSGAQTPIEEVVV